MRPTRGTGVPHSCCVARGVRAGEMAGLLRVALPSCAWGRGGGGRQAVARGSSGGTGATTVPLPQASQPLCLPRQPPPRLRVAGSPVRGGPGRRQALTRAAAHLEERAVRPASDAKAAAQALQDGEACRRGLGQQQGRWAGRQVRRCRGWAGHTAGCARSPERLRPLSLNRRNRRNGGGGTAVLAPELPPTTLTDSQAHAGLLGGLQGAQGGGRAVCGGWRGRKRQRRRYWGGVAAPPRARLPW